MAVLSSVHSLTLSLSRVLQTKNQDLAEAMELADSAKKELQIKRNDADKYFDEIFESVKEISREHDFELQKPRLSTRQIYRSNILTDSVEDYFKVTVYIPYLDTFIMHLQDRFLKHRDILSNFSCLFPEKMPILNEQSCIKLFNSYSDILRDNLSEIWIAEIKLWRRLIGNKKIKNSLEALDVCNEDAFPNVNQMLRILAVLPVTTATNERAFSTLRRIKTYLRLTMTEERLNGLATLNIHREVEVDPQTVLEQFFSVPRRVKMLVDVE